MSILEKNKTKDDQSLDVHLRPKNWQEYVGQEKLKQNLKIILGAARGRNETVEHLLFYGPPGLGKTTLAHLIAKEMNAQLKISSGPAIEKVGDLASILTNLSPGDVLFIDEAHRLNKMIEEVLYPAMESRSLNIIIGKGPAARTIQLDLPAFTLVAATTRIALLSAPLRSRFSGGTFRLEYYNTDEIKKIIKRSADILSIDIENDAAQKIAERSRFTPRVANRLLKRCRDFAQVAEMAGISGKVADDAMKMLQIDELGLETTDIQLLKVLITKFGGGPTGLQTLAAATGEETATIEEVYEPYLIQLGFIERTPRGRMATPRAYGHLGLEMPGQNRLL